MVSQSMLSMKSVVCYLHHTAYISTSVLIHEAYARVGKEGKPRTSWTRRTNDGKTL